MLYELDLDPNGPNDRLKPVPFMGFDAVKKLEKDLENVLAAHLFEVLFEDRGLMPIFQERAFQGEADIYALDERGDLVLFELKRGTAPDSALPQILGYAQTAGTWTYNDLQTRFDKYRSGLNAPKIDLGDAHKGEFELDHRLPPIEFNRRQKLYVVGSAASTKLIGAIDYWKSKGLAIDFVPYRVYSIGGKSYFEFFAPPYDVHQNPGDAKGVLFDTNSSYNPESVWHMIENQRVSAFGGVKNVVSFLAKNDLVFYVQKRVGLIAAATVLDDAPSADGDDELYRKVRFETPTPLRDKGFVRWMSHADACAVTQKNFFWARTIKVPYLTMTEAHALLSELRKRLSS